YGKDGQVIECSQMAGRQYMLCDQVLPGHDAERDQQGQLVRPVTEEGDKCLFHDSFPLLNCDGAPGSRPKAMLAGKEQRLTSVNPWLMTMVRGAVDAYGDLLAAALPDDARRRGRLVDIHKEQRADPLAR